MSESIERTLSRAAAIIKESRSLIAFTGAGISVESGIRPFRGSGGLWDEYDQSLLEIDRFNRDPEASWEAVRAIFYAALPDGSRPAPNAAHRVLAEWEREGILAFTVTQNIDGLHAAAGSRKVAEFHGSVRELVCRGCGGRVPAGPAVAESSGAPVCACGGILKPDFVFFGEGIPREAYEASFVAAARADACLVIGSTGVVYPAARIPMIVKESGGSVIEIDPGDTEFSGRVSDVHVRLGAAEAMTRLDALLRGGR